MLWFIFIRFCGAGSVLRHSWNCVKELTVTPTYTAACREASGPSFVQLIGVGVGVNGSFRWRRF